MDKIKIEKIKGYFDDCVFECRDLKSICRSAGFEISFLNDGSVILRLDDLKLLKEKIDEAILKEEEK